MINLEEGLETDRLESYRLDVTLKVTGIVCLILTTSLIISLIVITVMLGKEAHKFLTIDVNKAINIFKNISNDIHNVSVHIINTTIDIQKALNKI